MGSVQLMTTLVSRGPAAAVVLDDETVAADAAAKAAFEALAFSHRKEYARWVADAKREETRDRRVTRALEMLHQGKTLS